MAFIDEIIVRFLLEDFIHKFLIISLLFFILPDFLEYENGHVALKTLKEFFKWLVYLLIYLFIQQIIIDGLLYAKYSAWEYHINQTDVDKWENADDKQ